jgi:hypothetical protein
MFLTIFFILTALIFIWRMRTDSEAKILAKLIVSAVVGLVGTLALYAVYYFLKFLFVPILIALGIWVLYLALFAKSKASK